MSYLQEEYKIRRQVFCPMICSIQGTRRIFIQQATYKGSVPCVLNQEFLFLFTSIGVQKRPVLVSVSAPTRLALRGSHVWRLYQKRTPLNSKSSTIKGLFYAQKILLWSIRSEEGPHHCLGGKRKKAVIRQGTNAIHGMGTLKIPLQSIRSEEGPHNRLGAKRKEAVIRQATINPIHEFGYPLVIPYPGCTA